MNELTGGKEKCITISFIICTQSHNNCRVKKSRTRAVMHMTGIGERRNGFRVPMAKPE